MKLGIHITKDSLIRAYVNLVDKDVDIANRLILHFIGFLAYLWKANEINRESISQISSVLRKEILEGPNFLNPYLAELLGILEEGLNENNFVELTEKIKLLEQEERLDKLEV